MTAKASVSAATCMEADVATGAETDAETCSGVKTNVETGAETGLQAKRNIPLAQMLLTECHLLCA